MPCSQLDDAMGAASRGENKQIRYIYELSYLTEGGDFVLFTCID